MKSIFIGALCLLLMQSCEIPPTAELTPTAPMPTESVTVTPSETSTPSDTPTDYLPTMTAIPSPTSSPSPTALDMITPSITPSQIDEPSPTQIYPSQTNYATLIPPPTPTFKPPATATLDISDGPEMTPPISEINRLQNPGFEGALRMVDLPEINVFDGWWPAYCDTPHTPEKCPALRLCEPGQTEGCNPPDLMMRRPEFGDVKAKELPYRVHSGNTAQRFFCFYGACIMGLYQTFPTIPGETCRVGAFIQSWSNYDNDLESELETQDDRDNSEWFILVDPYGGTFAFDPSNLPNAPALVVQSHGFGYDYGIYDQYVLIEFEFVAQSNEATVFFLDRRLFPIRNNDGYIDDAFAYCQ